MTVVYRGCRASRARLERRPVPASRRRAGRQRREDAGEAISRVAHDPERRDVHAPDRARIEVDLDQGLVRPEREIEEQALGRAMGEPTADG
jgi:hypothetical protein